jgi:enamine deaminase RidA (YjgF/YER057c/UK114 family)
MRWARSNKLVHCLPRLNNDVSGQSPAGATLDDVVDLVTYHLTMDDLPIFARVKSEFFPANFPAWTVVGVTALALPELLIEVKATAVIGSAMVSS